MMTSGGLSTFVGSPKMPKFKFLLLGAIYALYKFIFFSLIEVKKEFGRRHDDNLKSMNQLHQEMAEMKSDLKLIADFVKDMMRK